MPLSLTEESYLNVSLSQRPPCRPDGRNHLQFRPIDAAAGILPTTNGSARIRLDDGGECIVGVKAEVIAVSRGSEVISVEVDCDIVGLPANSPLQNLLCATLETAIKNSLPLRLLRITNKYRYKIFVDGIILDHVSHPLTLFSMTTYLALLDTRLPRLAPDSAGRDNDDKDDIGIPQFSSDWDDADRLCQNWSPPLVQLGIIVGKNVFVDATGEEAEVSDGGLLTVWHDGRVVGLRVVKTRDSSKQVFSVSSISNAVEVLANASRDIEKALKGIITY
ncbi:ribosomal protein S5 domain 2-type protein [Lipomyces tetrasporus]|uniref:Ribosomal RNA-processing protein 42 n=1 Tax=Lipomyces tetrasporus TaxID=54092 RepID=A0AAD7VUF3_9ASCO|nr:ribosomal protein S5 domain 2-type protein [Lipomyces tetrasporus]KAJ8101769.1 ribosomal protein S5 domain 2-type protein [Lipomyces tetrasporus]